MADKFCPDSAVPVEAQESGQARAGKSGPAILAAVGVLLIVIGIVAGIAGNKSLQKFIETAETATATITDIRSVRSGNSTHYEVMVSFTAADGVTREVKLGEYNSSMQAGGAITVYYDPLNPARIKTEDSSGSGFAAILVIIGLGAGIIGASAIVKQRRNQKLRATGERYTANILDCRMTTRRSRGRVSRTFKLICQYVDGDGVLRECKSDGLSYDPRPQLPGGTVTVYVGPGKPKKYFVDVDGSMSGNTI